MLGTFIEFSRTRVDKGVTTTTERGFKMSELIPHLGDALEAAVEAEDVQETDEEDAPSVLVRMFVCEKRTYAKRPDLSIRPCSNINTLVQQKIKTLNH